MNKSAFTLIELLTVIAIIALLVGLTMPVVEKMRDKARSTACISNLRQIGAAVNLYVGDHDGTYPLIEPDPHDPVYPSHDIKAKPILDVLAPYGLTPEALKCPADAAEDNSYYQKKGGSYQWVPFLDGEKKSNPQIYTRQGVSTVNPSHIRLCMDYDPVHFNRCNILYGDGHVVGQLHDPAP